MQQNKTQKKKQELAITPGKIVVICVVGIVLLALLGCLVLYGVTGHFFPRANTLKNKDNYSFSEEKLATAGGEKTFRGKMDDVVATYGDYRMTNGMLQLYYWSEVDKQIYDGLNYTQPFHTQIQDANTGLTWQQFFLQKAIETWRSHVALTIAGTAAGYQMPEEYAVQFDTMEADLTAMAEQYAYADIADYIGNEIAYGARFEDYKEYLWLYYYSALYFQHLKDTHTVTQAELEQHFVENEAALAAAGITKESGTLADIRHILLTPTSATGSEEYTVDEWNDCMTRATMVLSIWESGEKTVESFGDLAAQWSTDSYTKDSGGLYEKVYAGQMESLAFDKWCFEEERSEGDYTIVTSEFGCHIVYFVARQTIWEYTCRQDILANWSKAYSEELLAGIQPKINYRAMLLGPQV